MSDRPRLGISACLLGESVRYDGAHKRHAWLVEVLGPQVDWVPVCPEVEAGLGTPREPMQIERTATGEAALMTVKTRRNLTPVLQAFSRARAVELVDADLDGYVFKADSPSCDPDSGLFAQSLAEALPQLPVIDERSLSDPAARQTFVDRVFAHHRGEDPAEPVGLHRPVTVVRFRNGTRESLTDRTATEEPLEIRLHGRPFAVIMRTPGADRELAAGFLLAERVIHDADDIGTIEYCADDRSGTQNIVNVRLADDAEADLDRLLDSRRHVTTNSSCGLCGRQTIESLTVDVPPIVSNLRVDTHVLLSLPARLRTAQTGFDETGGLHAAGLFTLAGELVDVAEDVGRHNAVDKVVGRMLMRERLPLADHVLCVSGRTSFEIVQKALIAGVPIIVAVSAASSLAVDLANAAGITLVGFVRGESANVYTHANRVIG